MAEPQASGKPLSPDDPASEATRGSRPQWTWLARIRRPQGRKGEVFADILTDFPEKFADRRQLWLLTDDVPLLALDLQVDVKLTQTAQLQVRPNSGGTVVRSLSAQTPVTVVKSEGGWSLIASEGKPIGYVATRDLAPVP